MAFGPKRRETVTFRDAPIIFKNFTGEKRQYNNEGNRNFSIMMREEDALNMKSAGWNIKALKMHEDDDEQLYHIKVAVSYANQPPQIWLVTGKGSHRTLLSEGLIGMLDRLDSVKIDLVISAFDWEVNGNTGRKAYLQSLYFHQYEDELALEYADMPQLSAPASDGPLEIEPGSRMAFDYDGEVEE
jgi:hypothetical protein